MFFELFKASSDPVLGTFVQHFFNKGFAAFRTISRIFDAHIDDLLVYCKRIFRVLTKGKLSTDNFICQNSKRPKINRKTIALSSNDLRSYVVRSADNGVCSVSSLYL